MLSRLRSHVRHNVVGYIALFIALSGTAYAAKPLITGADVQDGSLTDADIAAANKDGTANTASLRTLGTGAQQAVAGNDSRLSDARAPTGAAGGDLTGTYPNPDIASGSVGTSETGTIPAVRVNNTTNQAVSSSTFTTLSFDAEQFDTAGMHSTSSSPELLTAPVGGIYEVSAWLQWGFSGVDDPPPSVSAIIVSSNGSRVADSETISQVTNTVQNLSGLLQLSAGDTVHLQVISANSTAGTVFGTPAAGLPALSMAWIGPKGT